MAKKTIISDFSALKGKVTFSDKSSDIKVSPKVSDKSLKIGQSVVLMESNLRGKITGLSKTVRIELEDGLVIESAYGEFAVTDKEEIASLKDTKVKARKSSTGFKRSTPTKPDGSLPSICTLKKFQEEPVSLRDSSCNSRWTPSEG